MNVLPLNFFFLEPASLCFFHHHHHRVTYKNRQATMTTITTTILEWITEWKNPGIHFHHHQHHSENVSNVYVFFRYKNLFFQFKTPKTYREQKIAFTTHTHFTFEKSEEFIFFYSWFLSIHNLIYFSIFFKIVPESRIFECHWLFYVVVVVGYLHPNRQCQCASAIESFKINFSEKKISWSVFGLIIMMRIIKFSFFHWLVLK